MVAVPTFRRMILFAIVEAPFSRSAFPTVLAAVLLVVPAANGTILPVFVVPVATLTTPLLRVLLPPIKLHRIVLLPVY